MGMVIHRTGFALSDCPDDLAQANAEAAILAIRHRLQFEADIGSKWQECLLRCFGCDEMWEARVLFYIKHPFGCPDCTPDKADLYRSKIAHPLRVLTAREWQATARTRLTKLAWTLPEKERGRLFGLAKKEDWTPADFKAAHAHLAPAEDLIE